MGSLLDKFAAKIDLIYIDPPFATGADFSFIAQIGEASNVLEKQQSAIEEKAYRDTWGRGLDSYLQVMYPRLALMHEMLADTGSIFVHLDFHVGAHVKALLDEIFGRDQLRNEVIWFYKGGALTGIKRGLPRKHDNLFWYSKTDQFKFNQVRQEDVSDQMATRWGQYADKEGRVTFGEIRHEGDTHDRARKRYLREHGAEPPDDEVAFVIRPSLVRSVWDDIPEVRNSPRYTESVGFETQKPLALLHRILSMCSDAGDLVADFFVGSGTSLVSSEVLGRRWIGCDLGRWAIHVSRKRMLAIEECRPFEVLNLGKYERQYWQGITFKKKGQPQQQALYEYLGFILRLYGAQPVSGMQHLHGKKGRALVHIGAVDAPVTIDEINLALQEAVRLRQNELHVLGWEWEMGLSGLMEQEAKRQGVRLLLLQIPREVMEAQAVEKGDIQFFELAYLEVEIKEPRKLTVQVALKDFVIPNTELIPEDVRAKIKKWSDYIDYWAVDWDFQNDTFMQGWVAYRTRKERKLPLVSDPHIYDLSAAQRVSAAQAGKPGKYRVLVKVIDIFGNDTSQAFDVDLSAQSDARQAGVK